MLILWKPPILWQLTKMVPRLEVSPSRTSSIHNDSVTVSCVKCAVGKRKHATLPISQKLYIISRFESGTSCSVVTASYNTGLSTTYDIQKQKNQL
jgi:hypothetical protein